MPGPAQLEAGVVSRGLAFAVDVAVVGLFVAFARLAGQVVVGLFVVEPPVVTGVARWVLGDAAVLLAAAVYLAGGWSLGGQTLGKWLAGVKVVRADGGPVGPGRALLRFVCYSVSAAALLLGFAWIAVDPHRRGFHDLLAGTRVVYARPQGRQVRVSVPRGPGSPR